MWRGTKTKEAKTSKESDEKRRYLLMSGIQGPGSRVQGPRSGPVRWSSGKASGSGGRGEAKG